MGLIAIGAFVASACQPVRFKVRIVEAQRQSEGHYALLYEVIEPANYAGRYGVAATGKSDRYGEFIGAIYEIQLNAKLIGALGARPVKYSISALKGKDSDFLEMAKLAK
jgi:hypothetical protein